MIPSCPNRHAETLSRCPPPSSLAATHAAAKTRPAVSRPSHDDVMPPLQENGLPWRLVQGRRQESEFSDVEGGQSKELRKKFL
jgi:hypothetical protein